VGLRHRAAQRLSRFFLLAACSPAIQPLQSD